MKGANSSKIPIPLLTASYSFNETIKNNQVKGKTKRQPMIPRSKSRKRNENDKVKFDIPSKTEFLKNHSNNTSLWSTKKSVGGLLTEESVTVSSEDGKLGKSLFRQEIEEKYFAQKLLRISSLSLKSCQNFGQVTKEESETSYKEAQEETVSSCLSGKVKGERKEEDNSGPLTSMVKNAGGVGNDKGEAINQDRTIRNLYETIKGAVGPVFDNFKCVSPESATENETEGPYSDSIGYESGPDFSSVQEHYEFTLKEISNIWKNTIGLIGSVRHHAVEFVEENSKLIDKEQLTLEAEMLQIALDFAINYSKLKTDFLIKSVRKRLKVKNLKKSELENFMDSRTFGALYSNDDLAAMARTVQDLNTSLLNGEDLELE